VQKVTASHDPCSCRVPDDISSNASKLLSAPHAGACNSHRILALSREVSAVYYLFVALQYTVPRWRLGLSMPEGRVYLCADRSDEGWTDVAGGWRSKIVRSVRLSGEKRQVQPHVTPLTLHHPFLDCGLLASASNPFVRPAFVRQPPATPC